jgi:hypothetical protein
VCDMGERNQLGLELVDPSQGSRDKLARRQLPGADEPGELECRTEKQIVYHCCERYKVLCGGWPASPSDDGICGPQATLVGPPPPQET